ncbi:hypothetical protein, partial [Rhizobium sp.]|uniref:hypothetical protein n=1 Tax=Rhizobium sp. TaxID=391 RepID=UPI0028A6CBEB
VAGGEIAEQLCQLANGQERHGLRRQISSHWSLSHRQLMLSLKHFNSCGYCSQSRGNAYAMLRDHDVLITVLLLRTTEKHVA